jgi:hypothetical protein
LVQVNQMEPALKAPGSERLKLKRDVLHSNFAFNLNLRRYSEAADAADLAAANNGCRVAALRLSKELLRQLRAETEVRTMKRF